MKFLTLFFLLAQSLLAQINGEALPGTNAPPDQAQLQAQRIAAYEQATESIRDDCVKGRRTICGRIIKLLPDGMVVDSGYTSLMRPPLTSSWLVPGTVEAKREPNLVEAKEPGCICVGLVFLTDTPKSRLAKPKTFDYVVIQAYPTGSYDYNSVGSIHRTVRRFSAVLQTAVRIDRAAAGIQPPFPSPEPPAKDK